MQVLVYNVVIDLPGATQALREVLMAWPLRSEVLDLICDVCGLPAKPGSERKCAACSSGAAPRPAAELRCAYVSLLYGEDFAAPALTLGQSLREIGSSQPCMLMHTPDVPEEQLVALREIWDKVILVDYILCVDLARPGKFESIFTKLHCLDPELLLDSSGQSFHKILFLDLDTILLGRIEELFEIRPPAAMTKDDSYPPFARIHNERIPIGKSYFNAGVLLLAPNKDVFLKVREDVSKRDDTWHCRARCPEQYYLSQLLDGEYTHISQKFNFEVMPHGGVPLSDLWCMLPAEDIKVAHFSGAPKAWELSADCPDTYWIEHNLNEFPENVNVLATDRQRVLHTKWHYQFEQGLTVCQSRLLPWDVPDSMQLPRDFSRWVQTPPPFSVWPQERLDGVLRRLPRVFKACARAGCGLLCTWHATHCCRKCCEGDPGVEDEDSSVEQQPPKHGWRCDWLPANSPETPWPGPAAEIHGW